VALGGVVFSFLGGGRKWLLVSGGALAYLLMHGLQGWCPPAKAMRRFGVRSRIEIDAERYALKLLRGDFESTVKGISETVEHADALVETMGPDLTAMTKSGKQIAANLDGIVADVRAGKGTVGKLMTDEQLYAELNRFAVSARTLTDSLRSDRGTLGRLMNDRRAAESLEASLANIQTLTQRINAGEGSIGKLLNDDAFSRSLTSATANFDAVAASIKKGDGTMGKLVTDPALFDKMNSMSGRLDELVLHLNQGEGTAGRLLKDAALYENMNKVTTEISALIAEIKKDPRKYLTVRVSIF